VKLCSAFGAEVKNALLCLGANYDRYPGLVACALEAALLYKKGGLPKEHYIEIALQMYGHDWGALCTLMGRKWGKFKAEALPPAMKTRSTWRKELGHDVFIHPATLEPCRSRNGTFLAYEGLVYLQAAEPELSFITLAKPDWPLVSSRRSVTFPAATF
jgi:hypothetical protein